MKTFTNCAEKKAKQFLNLLQGYTKGIRITAILILLLMGVSNAWAATQRYIYVGISNNYQTHKNSDEFGFNFWGGTSGGVKSGTYIAEHTHDGRKYYMYRVQVHDDNNKAQFKGNNNWWEGECDVTLNGTTKNAVFFSHSNDGWQGQFQENYQVTSTASLAASKTSVLVGDNVTLTPSLSSNATYNTIKSTTYRISPNTGATISSNTFKATKAGTYTVTATVTYNAKDFTGITKTANDTKTIKVHETHYVLRGSINATGDPKGGMAGWDATNNNAYTVTTEGNIMTIVANLTNAKTQYKFKIYNCFDDAYYGQTGSSEIPNNTSWTLNGSNDVKFTTTAAGPYTFIYNTSNKSIKVQYPTAYTVTYGVGNNKGTDAVTTNPTITSGDLVLASTSIIFSKGATKAGYKWKNWNSKADGTGTNLGTGETYTSTNRTAGIDVYACYDLNTYTVAFDANGGTGEMTPQEFEYSKEQKLNKNTFTKDHYTFAGWATTIGGDKAYNDQASVNNLTTTDGATITLYAKWTPINYTITYNTNGGSGTMTPTSYTIETETFDLPTPTKDGCTFVGWYNNEGLTGDAVSQIAKGSYGNKIFYAKWDAKKFTLKWDANGGTITTPGSPEGGEVKAGTPLTPPTVTKDHYDHTGWNPEVPAVMPGEDVTYTAQWTPKKYTITYNLNGGSGTMTPTTYTIESETFALPNNPTKTGHTFAGWYANAELTGEAVTQIEKGSTGDKEYWAKWEVISYTITFDLEGGTGGTTTELTVPFGAQLPDITIPTKAGHLFLGYYNGDNGTGTQYYDASGKGIITMPANNLTLHAKWLNGSDCIFFYNNLGWSNVYVYFYSSDKYWDDSKGTGSKKEQTFPQDGDADHKPHYLEYRGKMTKIEGTNIWYYNRTVHGDINRDNYTTVAFTKDQQYNYEFFYDTEVVRRGDFNSNVPMFVSMKVNKVTKNEKTSYYNTGYWMNYPTNTGYKLHIFDKDGNKINEQLVDIPFEYSDNTIMPWSVNVSLEGAMTYAFKIQRADGTNDGNGTWYGNNATMTTNSSGDIGQTAWEFTTGTNNCKITTTAPGTYVFTLKYDKDRNSNYNYLVGVKYPASEGDYRLAYKDNTHPFHPGHLLKKRAGSDIVSFFVHYNENPLIMLQQVTDIDEKTGAITWKTLKTYALTANQPVGDNPGQAMISGRRNADEVILHIGDEHMDGVDATGIYNFVLEQTDSEATLQNTATKYTGNFYIRTNAAAGGWGNFRQNGNKMTYTSYADNQGFNFNHYFVEWINQGTNVKFTIANDYSYCLSDTLDADDIVTTGNLPQNANVRFGWNSKTNELSRAYISGSAEAKDRFLVLEGNEYLKDINGNALNVSGLDANEAIFSDKQNWIYQLDVQANSNTEITLTAKYNNKVQTFFGTSKSGFGGEPIMQATNDDYHKVRMIYDFKTNNLIAAWLLDETQYPETKEVASNMLIIRENQGVANQINFSKINDDMKIQTAYAVMTFTQEWVKGENTRDRSEYWVSFPFDVKISDVFGFSEYGDQWIMQLYDGAERAEKGNWIDSPTFWKYITNRNYTLKAGVGYVLKLNPSKMTFDHGATDVSLFFPSQGIPTIINADPTPITVPAHECTIERDNRNIYDSHWNLIGVPGYANLNDVNTKYTTGNQAENVNFYYAYNAAENNYAAAAATADFKNMYAYMVQFAGTIDWKNDPKFNNIPQQLAARHNSDAEPEKRTLRLEIAQGEEVADQTFVQLQQEGATPEFDMNLDLTKIINSGANIYTLAGDARIQVAGNALPVAETTIPVGVQMATAGEYTFRMPNGTEGMVVELIDYETNTRTNLLLSDYTTTLPAGSFENRFALIVKPDKVATDMENIGEGVKNNEAAKKYIIDGKLFLQKNGMLYDAQGHIVR